ncbi:MAG: FecR domain-containing protein [Odoribacter sp.]
MQDEKYTLSALIARFLAGEISEEERKELEEWKEASPRNRALFDELCDPQHIAAHRKKSQKYNQEKGWKSVKQQIHHRQVKKFIIRYSAYAAAIVLVVTVSYFFMYKPLPENSIAVYNQEKTILPGSAKAILTLADGSVVDLEEKQTFKLQEKNGTTITKDSSILNYKTKGSNRELVYNKIEIPRGGEYTLKLSDGTIVYLNAMSSLRFPVHFSGATREVELEGEAYFEVSKQRKPFIVKTAQMNVEVLGTVFNISCYSEDNIARTTLVNGSVKVTSSCLSTPLVLKPSQQAHFDKASHRIQVENVDVEQYIAWKSGHFYFKDWRLEDIMIYLSRWYDIQVFYQNNTMKDLKFGCNINRYGDISPILELFEETGQIKACLKGKTIILSQK